MPSANYSVTTGSVQVWYESMAFILLKQATGFDLFSLTTVELLVTDYAFAVHSSNVSLPLTVTQAEIDTFKATATALQTALTRIAALEADHATAMNNMNNNNGGY